MAVGNGNFPDRNDRRYISAAMDAPMLERQYESDLGRRWRDDQDADALHELIESHIRLVVRIATKYKGYGLPIGDLIQEGNTGLLEAANRFDPERNVRFRPMQLGGSWPRCRNISSGIRRLSASARPCSKSLFFNLRKLRAKIADNSRSRMTEDERQTIARELGVPLAAVERMESHFSRPDQSLNATVGESDSSDTFVDLLADDSPTPEAIVGDLIDSETRSQWISEAMEHLNTRERRSSRGASSMKIKRLSRKSGRPLA